MITSQAGGIIAEDSAVDGAELVKEFVALDRRGGNGVHGLRRADIKWRSGSVWVTLKIKNEAWCKAACGMRESLQK